MRTRNTGHRVLHTNLRHLHQNGVTHEELVTLISECVTSCTQTKRVTSFLTFVISYQLRRSYFKSSWNMLLTSKHHHDGIPHGLDRFDYTRIIRIPINDKTTHILTTRLAL